MRYIIQLISLRKPKRYQIFRIIHNHYICRRIKKEILKLRELNKIPDFRDTVCEYLSFINLLKDNGFDIIYHLPGKTVLTTSFPKVCLKFITTDEIEVSMIMTLNSNTKVCSIGYLEKDCAFREISLLSEARVVLQAADYGKHNFESIDSYKGNSLDVRIINETVEFIIQSLLIIFKEFLYINQ